EIICTAAAEAPGMLRKASAVKISHANPLGFRSWPVDLVYYRGPDWVAGRACGVGRAATDTEDCANRAAVARADQTITANQNDSRSAVARNVRAGSVDHLREFHLTSEKLID